jgi:hypothetical protein
MVNYSAQFTGEEEKEKAGLIMNRRRVAFMQMWQADDPHAAVHLRCAWPCQVRHTGVSIRPSQWPATGQE